MDEPKSYKLAGQFMGFLTPDGDLVDLPPVTDFGIKEIGPAFDFVIPDVSFDATMTTDLTEELRRLLEPPFGKLMIGDLEFLVPHKPEEVEPGVWEFECQFNGPIPPEAGDWDGRCKVTFRAESG